MSHNEELKAFLLVVRQALLLIVRWIEKRYMHQPKDEPQKSGS